MEDLQRLYPIGIQTFSEIREENNLYIDKTEYVYQMTHSSSKYMFLSRLQRFGKSLLTSTLHSYFPGCKELFYGLAMECDNIKYEGHYQQMFYVIFNLLNFYVDMEVRTPRGRVDMVLRTKTTLYVMELKLDKNADMTMEQIDLKNYPERFVLCGLPVMKVAVNFDSERCTIGEWRIERE